MPPLPTTQSLDIDALRAQHKGAVCVPGEHGYDEAVSIWNGMITKRPAIVARASSAGDVAAAMRWAQSHGVEISVRGGGHNFAGHALCDGGLMIDLTPLKSIVIDPEARTAACGGGTTWAELDAAAQAHGLAVPGGFISHTGVGGLTLGGGIGWLTRKAGLSCDNLIGAEVVTPDGRVLNASESENADLFWALRGGGGNFGVVTTFRFRLTPVGPLVHLGLFFFGLDQGGDMFRFARGLVANLDDDTAVFLAGLNAPPEPFVPDEHKLQPGYALLVVSYAGEQGHNKAVGAVHGALKPLWELVTPIPFAGLQQMFDAAAPWGIFAYEKAVHLDELSDAVIDVIVEHTPKKASPMSFIPIFTLGGAFARVNDDAVAFGGRRSTRYVLNIAAIAPTRELADADTAWVRSFWDALVPHAHGIGSYVNFMNEQDDARVADAYGAKLARLASIKASYDPSNVLHLNANIKPTGGA